MVNDLREKVQIVVWIDLDSSCHYRLFQMDQIFAHSAEPHRFQMDQIFVRSWAFTEQQPHALAHIASNMTAKSPIPPEVSGPPPFSLYV